MGVPRPRRASTARSCRNLALVIAIMAVLVGVAVHGHADGCHDQCWACQASLHASVLPAIIVSFAITWLLIGACPAFRAQAFALVALPASQSRAPPSTLHSPLH